MDYSKVYVDVYEFLSTLEGDVLVNSSMVVDKQDGQYIILDWQHDGIECVDVWHTDGGEIGVWVSDSADGEEYLDEVFTSLYTGTFATLRVKGVIPETLKDTFIQNAKSNM